MDMYVSIYVGPSGAERPVIQNERVEVNEEGDLPAAVGRLTALVQKQYPPPYHEYRIAIRTMPFVD
jgi:hypothetical protein